MDKEYVEEKEQSRSFALLTSSLFEFGYMLSKGSVIKGVTVYLPKEWLAKYLDAERTDEVLQRYIALKSSSLNFEPFDAAYHNLVDEVTEGASNNPLKKIMIQNRIMLLVEYFFDRLLKKMKQLNHKPETTNAEIRKLMDAEALLVHDYSKPAPTIPELAKVATMSETKLKVLFKKVYGYSPYEYYQINRMNKARQMLLSRKYSIKETGMILGYHNLSNFTIAFKKVFNVLPSEI